MMHRNFTPLMLCRIHALSLWLDKPAHFSFPRAENHPAKPAPSTRRGERQQPSRVAAGGTRSLNPSVRAPLGTIVEDTIMEDHDPFDETSRAEELVLGSVAVSDISSWR